MMIMKLLNWMLGKKTSTTLTTMKAKGSGKREFLDRKESILDAISERTRTNVLERRLGLSKFLKKKEEDTFYDACSLDFRTRYMKYLTSNITVSLLVGATIWWVFLPDQMVAYSPMEIYNHSFVKMVKEYHTMHFYMFHTEQITEVINNNNLIEQQALKEELHTYLREGGEVSEFDPLDLYLKNKRKLLLAVVVVSTLALCMMSEQAIENAFDWNDS